MYLKATARLPKRFKIDAGRAEKELQKAVAETAVKAKKLFDDSADTFADKPVFQVVLKNYTAQIFTTNENYNRLNTGTKAHLISPKPGGVLVFPNAFGRKTNPGQLYAMGGYKSSDLVFTKLPVLHPGFPPRKFDKQVVEQIQPELRKAVLAALRRSFNL